MHTQTDRQRCQRTQAHMHAHTDRQTDTHTHTHTDTYRHTHTHTYTHRHTHRHKIQTCTGTQTHTHTDTDTQIQTQTHTNTHTHMHAHTHTHIHVVDKRNLLFRQIKITRTLFVNKSPNILLTNKSNYTVIHNYSISCIYVTSYTIQLYYILFSLSFQRAVKFVELISSCSNTVATQSSIKLMKYAC